MADDIVTRLREMDSHLTHFVSETVGWSCPICNAADEIEQLRHVVDRLNAALDDIAHLTNDRQVLHRIKEARRG